MRGFRDEDRQHGDAEPVRIKNVVSIAETPDAVLCEIPEHGQQWIPKSQIDDDSEVFADDQCGTLVITTWIAERKGLDE